MRSLVALIALVAAAGPAYGQGETRDSAETPASASLMERMGATVTLRASIWSSTRDLDPAGPIGAAMAWGKVTRPVNRAVSFRVDGWASLQSPINDGDARGELREAFLTVVSGPWEARIGRQIIAWGRADGINPTDNLTGQDLRLLTPDDSDRRFGAGAVKLTYGFGGVAATVIWLPEFRPHRVPLPPIVGNLDAAGSAWTPEQFAARVEQTGRAVDWSVSAFSGHDLNPDLGRSSGEPAQLQLAHHTIRVLGADATGNMGRYGLRVEAAYVRSEDPRGERPFVKNPWFSIVSGADRTFGEHLNVNVQHLYRLVAHVMPVDTDPRLSGDPVGQQQAVFSSQTRRHQHGASLRVSYKWLRDTLEAEVAAAGYVGPRGGVVRPKVSYAVSDRLTVLAGAELYQGDDASVFGLFESNSGGFAEVRWSF